MRRFFAFLLVVACAPWASAWDYEGHRLISQLAIASLPTNSPAFIADTAAAERLAFLSGEPDRWRNVPDLAFRHGTGPDHYIDLEELSDYGLSPAELPMFRYDFIGKLAVVRKEQPRKFPAIDQSKNQDRTRELVGLLPWAIVEEYGRVKSGFSCLRAYEENGGTQEEITNARANIIYAMGILSHFVGDAFQPLHLTIHHHGWAGSNPENLSTNRTIHSWIDGGYFAKVGLPALADLQPRLRTAGPLSANGRVIRNDELFKTVMTILTEELKQVETLYRFEQSGRLSGNGLRGLEGREFLQTQMLKAAQFLGDLWLTAYQTAPDDTFLKNQLARRKR